jgi:hypothetical protein
MSFNFIGLVAALATFMGVWFGHVIVRKIEYHVTDIHVPAALFAFTGIALEFFSVIAKNILLSTASGILGITLLWDALEFFRQQKRIKAGHAPANPQNPRHARFLLDHETATAFDWLNRYPTGRALTTDEIQHIKESHL